MRQQQRRVIPRRGFGNFHEPANISQLPFCSVFLGFLGFSRLQTAKYCSPVRKCSGPGDCPTQPGDTKAKARG